MPWYLNQYRKTKQGASIPKTYIGNTNRDHTKPSQALGQISQAMKTCAKNHCRNIQRAYIPQHQIRRYKELFDVFK